MTLPIFNWAQTVDGLQFFPQNGSQDVFYYGNWMAWGDLQKNMLGDKRVIFHGELRLGPETALLNKAKADLSAARLLPLSPIEYENEIELRHSYNSAHSIALRTIPSHPFETIVLSASVDLEESDGEETADKLENRWNDRSIFDGGVSSTYRFLTISISKSVRVQPRDFCEQVRDILGSDEADLSSALKAVSQAVGSGEHITIVQDGNELEPDADTIARLFVDQYMRKSIFRSEISLYRFDDGSVLLGEQLRDGNELGLEESFAVRKTSEADETISLSL